MNEENTFWFRIWTLIIFGIVLITFFIAGGLVLNNHLAMSKGYERVSLPGQACVQWKKVEVIQNAKNTP